MANVVPLAIRPRRPSFPNPDVCLMYVSPDITRMTGSSDHLVDTVTASKAFCNNAPERYQRPRRFVGDRWFSGAVLVLPLLPTAYWGGYRPSKMLG